METPYVKAIIRDSVDLTQDGIEISYMSLIGA
jgi:hypothetical protein